MQMIQYLENEREKCLYSYRKKTQFSHQKQHIESIHSTIEGKSIQTVERLNPDEGKSMKIDASQEMYETIQTPRWMFESIQGNNESIQRVWWYDSRRNDTIQTWIDSYAVWIDSHRVRNFFETIQTEMSRFKKTQDTNERVPGWTDTRYSLGCFNKVYTKWKARQTWSNLKQSKITKKSNIIKTIARDFKVVVSGRHVFFRLGCGWWGLELVS